jgi:CobQ/CobB/MinD/ParA nucleotide binding domain
MRTIVFYGYKGGSGRTLTLANIAVHLAQLGLKVAAIDLDLESPGLHYKLLPSLADATENDAESTLPPGVVGYLESYLGTGRAPDSVLDFGIDVPIAGQRLDSAGQLWLLPAGPAPTSAYWRAMEHIVWSEMSVGEPAPLVTMLVELKAQIGQELNPDYLMIDARTGVTEHNGVALHTLADHVVAFAMPNREHLAGATHVIRKLLEAGGPPSTMVLNRMLANDARRDQQIVRVRSMLGDLSEPVVFCDDPALRNGEFLHLGDWGRSSEQNGGSDFLMTSYLELISRIAPETANHLDAALTKRVNALKASIETSPLEDVRMELNRLHATFPSLATADGAAWAARLMRDGSAAIHALSRLNHEDLRKSTQLTASLEALLVGGSAPAHLVECILETGVVEPSLASRLRAWLGITN